jgi:hypothetical protein
MSHGPAGRMLFDLVEGGHEKSGNEAAVEMVPGGLLGMEPGPASGRYYLIPRALWIIQYHQSIRCRSHILCLKAFKLFFNLEIL